MRNQISRKARKDDPALLTPRFQHLQTHFRHAIQNCRRIDFYYFKLLNFVTMAAGSHSNTVSILDYSIHHKFSFIVSPTLSCHPHCTEETEIFCKLHFAHSHNLNPNASDPKSSAQYVGIKQLKNEMPVPQSPCSPHPQPPQAASSIFMSVQHKVKFCYQIFTRKYLIPTNLRTQVFL